LARRERSLQMRLRQERVVEVDVVEHRGIDCLDRVAIAEENIFQPLRNLE
jgi:hypothetical protein